MEIEENYLQKGIGAMRPREMSPDLSISLLTSSRIFRIRAHAHLHLTLTLDPTSSTMGCAR